MREMEFSGVGRFCADPEVTTYKAGKETKTRVTFALAFNRSAESDTADFFRMTAFGSAAEVIEKYCSKGAQIYVRGKITTSYNDENDVWYTNYVVNDFQLIGGKHSDEGEEKKPYKKK